MALTSDSRPQKIYSLYHNIEDFTFSMPGGWDDYTISVFLEGCHKYIEDLRNYSGDFMRQWSRIVGYGLAVTSNITCFNITVTMELAKVLKAYLLKNSKLEDYLNNVTFKDLLSDTEYLLEYFPNANESQIPALQLQNCDCSISDEDEPVSMSDVIKIVSKQYRHLFGVKGIPASILWSEMNQKVADKTGIKVDVKQYLEPIKTDIALKVRRETDSDVRAKKFLTLAKDYLPYFDYIPPRHIKKSEFLPPALLDTEMENNLQEFKFLCPEGCLDRNSEVIPFNDLSEDYVQVENVGAFCEVPYSEDARCNNSSNVSNEDIHVIDSPKIMEVLSDEETMGPTLTDMKTKNVFENLYPDLIENNKIKTREISDTCFISSIDSALLPNEASVRVERINSEETFSHPFMNSQNSNDNIYHQTDRVCFPKGNLTSPHEIFSNKFEECTNGNDSYSQKGEFSSREGFQNILVNRGNSLSHRDSLLTGEITAENSLYTSERVKSSLPEHQYVIPKLPENFNYGEKSLKSHLNSFQPVVSQLTTSNSETLNTLELLDNNLNKLSEVNEEEVRCNYYCEGNDKIIGDIRSSLEKMSNTIFRDRQPCLAEQCSNNNNYQNSVLSTSTQNKNSDPDECIVITPPATHETVEKNSALLYHFPNQQNVNEPSLSEELVDIYCAEQVLNDDLNSDIVIDSEITDSFVNLNSTTRRKSPIMVSKPLENFLMESQRAHTSHELDNHPKQNVTELTENSNSVGEHQNIKVEIDQRKRSTSENKDVEEKYASDIDSETVNQISEKSNKRSSSMLTQVLPRKSLRERAKSEDNLLWVKQNIVNNLSKSNNLSLSTEYLEVPFQCLRGQKYSSKIVNSKDVKNSLEFLNYKCNQCNYKNQENKETTDIDCSSDSELVKITQKTDFLKSGNFPDATTQSRLMELRGSEKCNLSEENDLCVGDNSNLSSTLILKSNISENNNAISPENLSEEFTQEMEIDSERESLSIRAQVNIKNNVVNVDEMSVSHNNYTNDVNKSKLTLISDNYEHIVSTKSLRPENEFSPMKAAFERENIRCHQNRKKRKHRKKIINSFKTIEVRESDSIGFEKGQDLGNKSCLCLNNKASQNNLYVKSTTIDKETNLSTLISSSDLNKRSSPKTKRRKDRHGSLKKQKIFHMHSSDEDSDTPFFGFRSCCSSYASRYKTASLDFSRSDNTGFIFLDEKMILLKKAVVEVRDFIHDAAISLETDPEHHGCSCDCLKLFKANNTAGSDTAHSTNLLSKKIDENVKIMEENHSSRKITIHSQDNCTSITNLQASQQTSDTHNNSYTSTVESIGSEGTSNQNLNSPKTSLKESISEKMLSVIELFQGYRATELLSSKVLRDLMDAEPEFEFGFGNDFDNSTENLDGKLTKSDSWYDKFISEYDYHKNWKTELKLKMEQEVREIEKNKLQIMDKFNKFLNFY